VVSLVMNRLLPMTSWNSATIRFHSDFRGLAITQVLTIFLVLAGSFGPYAPDINWHVPMSCLVIVLYLLIQGTLATGRIGTTLIVAYALFACFRLFSQYF